MVYAVLTLIYRSPALYEPYSDPSLPVPAIDEWTLSWAMANDTANGGMKQLEHHYDTFIVSLCVGMMSTVY